MKFSIQAIYSWYRNTLRNPKYRWWLILGTMFYLVMPFDVIPDIFPIVGEIDDIALITLLVSEVSQLLIEQVRTRRAETQTVTGPEATSSPTDAVDVDSARVE